MSENNLNSTENNNVSGEITTAEEVLAVEETAVADSTAVSTTGNGKKARTMIGGQSLLEGVMMRGATSMAMAVRTDEGAIVTETKRLKPRRWYYKVPILRGCIAFVDSLINGTGSLLKSAEAAFPDEESPSKGWFALSAVLGVVLAVGLFILLPNFAVSLFEKYVYDFNILISALIEGVLRVIIFILYLYLVSKMKDIKRTFMYHGAEHRTINCFEKGLPLTVENVQSCSTRHNRCGTTFLFFVMIISILVFALTNWIFSLFSVELNMFAKMGVRLALLPIVAGLSYELLRFLAKLPDNKFVAVLRAPGLALQRLTTYPPDDDMAEVAIKSFMLVYDMDNDPTIPTHSFGEITVAEIRQMVRKKLSNADIKEESETEWIIAAGLNKKRSAIAPTDKLTQENYKKIMSLASKRAAGTPLDYLTGFSEFYGYKLKVTTDVLIPRLDTEILVLNVIKHIGETSPTVLDLMTGSGCIALALSKRTGAKITASDISEAALKIAEHNLKDSGVDVVLSDCFAAFEDRKFDIIVSNPPYITADEMKTLSKDVLCQPETALSDGGDGLKFYRIIADDAPRYLTENGRLFLEIGSTQRDSVTEILSKNFTDIQCIKDLEDNDRVITAKKK